MKRARLITVMVMMAGAAAVPIIMDSPTNATGYVPEAYAFWITSDTSRFRMNVSFVTADIPQVIYDRPEFNHDIRARGGECEVKVWHYRDLWQQVGVVKLPMEYNRRVSHRVGSLWQNGDVIAYEYNPCMQVGQCDAVGRCTLPFASLIDNVSNDPVTWTSKKIPIHYSVEVH